MVVLSVSICTRKGKVLLARQYVPMARIRVESLMSAFTALLDSEKRVLEKQHTFIETNDVRYLYQNVDDLYLLLVTNLQSNIFEDNNTLQIIKKVIPKSDSLSYDNMIDLVPILDEIVTPMGHKQHVTPHQIEEYINMRSVEEIRFNREYERKINHQNEIMKEKAKLIQKINKTNEIQSKSSLSTDVTHHNQMDPILKDTTSKPTMHGMILVSNNRLDKIEKESKVLDDFKFGEMMGFECIDRNDTSSVEIMILEKLNVTFDRDGTMKKFIIVGNMDITVNEARAADCILQTNILADHCYKFGKVCWKLHPKMDATQWKNSGTLCLKKDKRFKVGSSSAISILKWRINIGDEKYVPLIISFWTEIECDGTINITAQCKANTDLKNVIIECPYESTIKTQNMEKGDYELDMKTSTLRWFLYDLCKDEEVCMEYSVNKSELECLFPVQVSLETKSILNIQITETNYQSKVTSKCVAQDYCIE